MRRHRFGWWVLVVWPAAGCSQATTPAAVANDQAGVWFLQHMLLYLRQTMVLSSLTGTSWATPGWFGWPRS